MLKVTLVGHASLLIQSNETTILTDPVWFDFLWEEINVLCPSIELQKDKVPPIDVLILSHRHQDHFDVRTLAFIVGEKSPLKPDATILAPDDGILLDVLKELEFQNVQIMADFKAVQVGDITITPTASLNQSSTSKDYYPEHGLLFSDNDVLVWNQVDSIVSPDIIQYMRDNYPRPDLVHSRFLPLIEGNFSYNKPCNLPFEEYCSFLNIMKTLAPKFVVPGSAAFRYRDEMNFLNQYSFPTTQEQFLRDLSAFWPEAKSSKFLNGDVAHVTSEGVRVEKQGSDFVRILEDDEHLVAFKPIMEVPRMQTRTSGSEEYKLEMDAVRGFIENDLINRIEKSEMLEAWQYWQVVYQLEIFGQTGSEVWHIDFGQKDLKIQKGEPGKTNLYEGIASSELHALIENRRPWDYVTLCGNYRTFNNIYRVTEGSFEFNPSEKMNCVFEPLMEAFPWDHDMDREKYMKDVRRWKGKA
ncbi:MAG: MBL fold metallo-hydrolase [Nitrospinales bacterium]